MAQIATTIPVSYAELARQGVHALRGLGYSFSVADRAAHTLAATEAMTRLGLKCLEASAAEIEATARTSVTASTPAAGATLVDARGKSLLELSPFLLDVAIGDAKKNGQSAVLAENIGGMPFISDMALRAVTQGARIRVFYADGGASRPLAAAPAVFLVENGRISGDVVEAGEGFWSEAAESLKAAQRKALTAVLQAPVAQAGGRVLIIGEAADTATATNLTMLTGTRSWQAADGWKPAYDRAINGQIDAEVGGFDFFFRCVRRIWVPTSERSRRQQG